jgi:ferritin
MVSERMAKALNDQINAELHSAYLYLAMAAYFDSKNLSGFARWMKVQYQEEVAHALRFYEYLNERGQRVILKSIDGPQIDWNSPLAAFEAAYKHEVMISGRISKLVDCAIEERDHATNTFLQWFVKEQVEEEAHSDRIVRKLTMLGDSAPSLFMLDHELSQRKGD